MVTLLRLILIISAAFCLYWGFKIRFLHREPARHFLSDGRLGIDVAGLEKPTCVGEDTISLVDDTTRRLVVRNDGSFATRYTFTAENLSGTDTDMELTLADEAGRLKWQGTLNELRRPGAYQSILPILSEEALTLNFHSEQELYPAHVRLAFHASGIGSEGWERENKEGQPR